MPIGSDKLITASVKEFGKPLLSKVTDIGKKKLDEFKVVIDSCFQNYLKRYYSRHSQIRTILYPSAPVDLRKYYVRTETVFEKKTVKENDFFSELQKRKKIVLLGNAGSGKSTFSKSLFIETIELSSGIIPILIELRKIDFEKSESVLNHIFYLLNKVETKFTTEQFNFTIEMGKFLFIFDGFDEIDDINRSQIEKEILEISEYYHDIYIVVTSRPDEIFKSWDEFSIGTISQLSKENSLNLINRLDFNDEVKKKFSKKLDEQLYEQYESFASNPLLLTMMLITYDYVAEIPEKLHLFYEETFNTIYTRHDSLKSLYKRKTYSGLSKDDFKIAFSTFCIITYIDNKYNFSENEMKHYLDQVGELCLLEFKNSDLKKDLLLSVSMMQKDGQEFSFVHRSFQEYFAALYISSYLQESHYEVIDQLFCRNGRDKVLMLLYGMNTSLVEQKYLIPKLDSLLSAYKYCDFNSLDERINILASLRANLDARHEQNYVFRLTYIVHDIEDAKKYFVGTDLINIRGLLINIGNSIIKKNLRSGVFTLNEQVSEVLSCEEDGFVKISIFMSAEEKEVLVKYGIDKQYDQVIPPLLEYLDEIKKKSNKRTVSTSQYLIKQRSI